MKKVQFIQIIKKIMFLSLLVSVIHIQDISAQRSSAIINYLPIQWCVVSKDDSSASCSTNYIAVNKIKTNGGNKDNLYYDSENSYSKITQEIIDSSLFIAIMPGKDANFNDVDMKYYFNPELDSICFVDCKQKIYKIAEVVGLGKDRQPVKGKDGQKQTLHLTNSTDPFQLTVTIKEDKDVSLEALGITAKDLPDCPKKPTPEPTPEPTPQSIDVDIPRYITVHFHKENGSPDSIALVDIGGKLLSTQLPKVEKEGYEFLGWYYKASDAYKLGEFQIGNEPAKFNLESSIYADIDLYAKWKQKEVVVPEQPKKAVPNTADR